MTPEKATMADMSGGKRDRISDHTDKPPSTPNTRDTKLLCNDAKVAIGKEKDGKIVEIEEKLDSVKIGTIDDGVVASFVQPAQKEVIDIDDLDSLIASGGLEHSPGSDIAKNVPKTLFDPNKDQDKMEESVSTQSPGSSIKVKHDDESLSDNSTSTKDKTNAKNTTTPTRTEKNDNKKKNKNNKKTEKEQKQATQPTQKFSEGTSKNSNALVLNEGFKPCTQMWKDADAGLKAIIGLAYKASDKDKKLLLNRASFLKHFKRSDDEEISRDQWVNYFIDSTKFGNSRALKNIKRFGIALASTDPTEIFAPEQFNGTILIGGPIENAWAGAYTVYGAAWKPEIGLDISDGIAPISTWWKNLGSEETSQFSPFFPSEVFSDNAGSMHDQEKHFKKAFGFPHMTAVPIKTWVNGFKKRLSDPSVRAILIKLALTSITVFEPAFFADPLEKTKLNSISVTNFWIGAYRIAGAPWNLKAPPPTEVKSPEQAAPVATATPSPKDHVSFDSSTKSPGLFISRAASTPNVITRPKSEVRKYQDVYYTVTTSPMEAQWKEGGVELTANFNLILDHILDKDKKAIIHQWQGKGGGKLHKNSSPLLNRIQVKKYCNGLFLRQGFPVVFRIRVSHDAHPSKLIVDDVNEGLHLVKDHIQELDQTIIGYLVGSSPAAANLRDMQESHENHPTLHGLKLEARVQAIKLTSGKNLIPWELQVRAIHIIVGESQANLARDKYNQVFGSRNVGGYPQAVNMRFVPDISDSCFPVTLSTRVKAIKMLAKQKAFLASTKQISTNTIACLHLPNAKVGYTLCQVLMSIRSVDNPELGLFISIDDELSERGYEVTFTVHNDRFTEANSLVPLLCILLEARFSIPIHELGWFTDDAKRVVTKYMWNKDQDCVVLIHPEEEDDDLGFDSDDEYMQSICNIFNIDREKESHGFEFDMNFVIEDEFSPKNQYGDSGSVKTFRHAFDEDGGAAAESFAAVNSANTAAATESMDTTPADTLDSRKPAALPTLTELIKDNPDFLATVIAKYHAANRIVSPEGVDER